MSPPRIDIIVPCHNYGRFLQSCVASALQDAHLALRVLVIDDASTDDTAEVAQALAAGDPRVSVRRHAVNQGHIATYNEGLAWARGDYLLLLSADDMLPPGALARAVAVMDARPRVSFVYGAAVRFAREDELGARTEPPAAAQLMSGETFIRRVCAEARNPVETATAVVRTRVQKAVGDYRPELPHAGDLEMWLRCAALGEVAYLPTAQGYVRMHTANMRHAYGGANFAADGLQRLAAFRAFFRDFGPLVPEAAALEEQARRRIADELFEAAWEAFVHDEPVERALSAALQLRPQLRARPSYARMAAQTALRAALGPSRWARLQRWKAALRRPRQPAPGAAGRGAT